LIQDTAALDSIVAQIAFWSEFFSKLLELAGAIQPNAVQGEHLIPSAFIAAGIGSEKNTGSRRFTISDHAVDLIENVLVSSVAPAT